MNDEGLYGFGQMASILRARFCDPRIRSLTKTDGLTFRVREIVEASSIPLSAATANPAMRRRQDNRRPEHRDRDGTRGSAGFSRPRSRRRQHSDPTRDLRGSDAEQVERFYRLTNFKEQKHERTTPPLQSESDQERHHGRSSHLVPRLRRFRRARLVLQDAGETPAASREDRDPGRHRLLLALSLFRQHARRSFHPRPRRALRHGRQPGPADLHVFVFGGDGDGFSIGGNHLEHGARKNIRLTYVIMDNFVYGLTKKQTSPTSPVGFRSKTDPRGRSIVRSIR